MIALVFAMILCLVLGLAVVGIVAIPARREGRDLLTPQGEEVLGKVKKRTEPVTPATRDRAGDVRTTGAEMPGEPASSPPQTVADVVSRDQTDVEAREAS